VIKRRVCSVKVRTGYGGGGGSGEVGAMGRIEKLPRSSELGIRWNWGDRDTGRIWVVGEWEESEHRRSICARTHLLAMS